jgi:COMPASS component SWD1
MTASLDWNCIIWDLASAADPPQRIRTIRFDVPLARALFHPRNRYVFVHACVQSFNGKSRHLIFGDFSKIVLVVLMTGEMFLDDSRGGQASRVELCEIVYESDEDEAQRTARPQYVYLSAC